MNNEIYCAISSSLSIKLPNIEKLYIDFIEPNKFIEKKYFSVLVYNKSEHNLYSESRFVSEDYFDVIAYYDNNRNSPSDIIEVCDVFDDLILNKGILSHQQIKKLMKLDIIIYEGKPSRIKGASYDLIVDKTYLKSGIKVLTEDSFKIDPLDYVVVGAVESVNLPRNICGMFDLKVSMFCKGIILSNGPQVDPGYQGRLMCLLFNASAKVFEIPASIEFEFATIQFHTLSKPTEIAYTGIYLRKQYIRDYIGSYADGSIAELVKSIPDIRQRLTNFEAKQKKKNVMRYILGGIVGLLITGAIYIGVISRYTGSLDKIIEGHDKRIEKIENISEKHREMIDNLRNKVDDNEERLKNLKNKKVFN